MELVWRRFSRVYSLCLLLSNVHLSLSSSLPGSCIAAGYTTCCNSEEDIGGNCAGDTGSCFCDPSCREYSDCCSDLDEICPTKDIFSPLAVFTSHITYHSATIRWATAHINVSFNHTYLISYTDPSTNSSSKVAARIQHASIGDVYSVNLSSLFPNVSYVSNIISTSEIYGEMTFGGPMITTLPLPTVRKVRANWLNSSSAQVWWEELILPQNVDVLHYLIYVGRNGDSGGMAADKGEIHQWIRRFEPELGHGMVTGLNSHTGYSFSVGAQVRDADGTVFETSKSPKVHVFIPGRQLFQLQGTSSVPCSAWNSEIESQVSTTFQDSITAAIRSKCGCLFPPSHVTDTSLLCHNTQATTSRNTSEINVRTPVISTSYVTFRANLLSMEGHCTDSLTDLVETWVDTAPLLQDVKLGLEIKIVPQCPLRLSRRSEPFCVDGADIDRTSLLFPVAQNLEMNKTEPLCITVPVLAASLAAEFLVLLTVFLVGIVITLLIVARRDRKPHISEMSYLPSSNPPQTSGPSATGNVYSSAPSTGRVSEAAAKEDEGEQQPSNMAAVPLSSSHTDTSRQVGENTLAATASEHEAIAHQR